jgi:hypothetical protein
MAKKKVTTSYNPLTSMVSAPAPRPTAAPTSGLIPGFTPSVAMPTPTVQPKEPGFVGPVAGAARKSTEEIMADVNRTIASLTPEYYAGIEASIKEANAAIAAAQTAASQATTAISNAGSSTRTNDSMSELYTQQRLDRMTQEQKSAERLSAYNILKMEFDQYGLGSLVTDIRELLINDTPVSEFGLRLRGTDAYKARFKANEGRIAAGLSALSPAEYVALEDQYQNVMRNYGLPASYYTKDETGKQVGFEKFIAGDVSASELEDRILTAQKRVINANPQVSTALKQFYPDITNGDILAYALDPSQGLEGIKRKVTAAEIGGAALQSGLSTSLTRAEELSRYDVDKQSATQGFATIAGGLQRGSQLASIYGQDPYTQAVAETEVFNIPGAQEARKKRQKITGLEKAAFSGQTGVTAGALTRDRAGGY